MKELCIESRKLRIKVSTSSKKGISRGLSTMLKAMAPIVEKFLWPETGGRDFYPSFARAGDKVALKKAAVEKVSVDVSLCGAQRIRSLNKSWRKKNRPTDVLSFPVYETLRGIGKKDIFLSDILLGDVVICSEIAQRQAREFGISWELEVVHLLIHGILHLCGYDHELSDKEEDLMFYIEDKLVEKTLKRYQRSQSGR